MHEEELNSSWLLLRHCLACFIAGRADVYVHLGRACQEVIAILVENKKVGLVLFVFNVSESETRQGLLCL